MSNILMALKKKCMATKALRCWSKLSSRKHRARANSNIKRLGHSPDHQKKRRNHKQAKMIKKKSSYLSAQFQDRCNRAITTENVFSDLAITIKNCFSLSKKEIGFYHRHKTYTKTDESCLFYLTKTKSDNLANSLIRNLFYVITLVWT